LIEEPELYLHPGMQRRLLQSFVDGALKGIQVIATTQSNHLLEVALESNDVSIFQITKNSAGNSEREVKPEFTVTHRLLPDREIIQALGVNGASVLLANCVILVEGIYDMLFIQKLLDIYWNENPPPRRLFRDIHYSFMFYSGANICQFDFSGGEFNADSLFLNFMCVADRDDDQKRGDRHRAIQELLKQKYEVLECSEIENLLSRRAVARILQRWLGQDIHETLFDNKRLQEERLGMYIDEVLGANCVNLLGRKKKFGSRSGTINDKEKFCSIAMTEIECLDDFIDYGKDLARKLSDFISGCNLS
jgi:hypothetical protein